jgi:hypothetical protein
MRYTINLFPQPERTVIDEVVYFAFHYLRYVLVITQFVVICVFFYRFKVDQEIVDLKDSLHNKREIIDSTATLLNEVRIVDGKINVANDLVIEQERTNIMVEYFFSKVPQEFELSGITIMPDSVSFTGETKDIDAIQIFYDSLNSDGRFEEVQFDEVTRALNSYSFSFQLSNYILSNKNNET